MWFARCHASDGDFTTRERPNACPPRLPALCADLPTLLINEPADTLTAKNPPPSTTRSRRNDVPGRTNVTISVAPSAIDYWQVDCPACSGTGRMLTLRDRNRQIFWSTCLFCAGQDDTTRRAVSAVGWTEWLDRVLATRDTVSER
jgi:hypothetical protein